MTDLQIETNRANAKHSTGPRTPAGKKRSSLNATRHGLTGQVVVLPQEDMQAYQTHCQEFFTEWLPQGPTERHLIQTLADGQWRLHRALARERAMFAMGHEQFGDQVNTTHPQVHALFTSAVVEIERSKELDRLSRYASRIQRDYHRTLKEVEDLQERRKAREQVQIEQAALLQKFFAMNEQEFLPAEFGFVLNNTQIAAHSHFTDTIKLAKLANNYDFNLKKFTRVRTAMQTF